MTTLTDTPDFLGTAHTSDGLNCFWVIEYLCPPLVQSTDPESGKDFELEVYVLCDHRPTIAEAIKAVPADENGRVHTVRVKPMHQSHFGKAFYQQSPFVDMHTGRIGPLDIQLRHTHTLDFG